jgi:HSP20 family protein
MNREKQTKSNTMSTLTKQETGNAASAAGQPQNGGRQQYDYIPPEVNVFETSDGYLLEAEMPGVNKDSLEITLEGNELTIIGRRNHAAPAAEVLWRESSTADYRRVFELDPAIDTGKIEAKVEQGLLRLNLPKSERVKPRKVTVSD